MAAWRAAGLNYINYSNIAARLLRKALKPEPRAQAVRRDESHIKFTKWQGGRPENVFLWLFGPFLIMAETVIKIVNE